MTLRRPGSLNPPAAKTILERPHRLADVHDEFSLGMFLRVVEVDLVAGAVVGLEAALGHPPIDQLFPRAVNLVRRHLRAHDRIAPGGDVSNADLAIGLLVGRNRKASIRAELLRRSDTRIIVVDAQADGVAIS